MEQRKEEVTRRPLYVYDLPKDVLSTLIRKDIGGPNNLERTNVADSPTDQSTPVETKTDTVIGSKACSLCGVSSQTVEEQRSHVRSDLHGYNLKQRVRGAKPVSEGEFEKLVGDLDESLSGSDASESEDEDETGAKDTTLSALLKRQAALSVKERGGDSTGVQKKPKRGSGKPPLFWFTTPTLPTNTYLGIYGAIFSLQEQEDEVALLETVRKKQLAPKPQQAKVKANANGAPLLEAYDGPHVFLCMIGGGHFAAMVVALTPKQTKSSATGPLMREATVLAHKTFHRYTTRRKQGGSQSANDNAKGAAHSAGAGIRRYNEQALNDEVRHLLQDWKGMIDTSELLFVRATGSTSRRTLYGPYDGQVLRSNDPRIRSFPFNTRRATQNELMRSFVELTRVKVIEVDEAAIAAAKAVAEESAKQAATPKPKQSAPTTSQRSEEEETALLHTTQIQAMIRRSRVPALLSYLKTNDLSPDFFFYPQDSQQNHHAPTALHLAASQNCAPLISGLLVKADANPTLTNNEGKTAFELSGDRATRDAFRVARSELGESKWDWDTARIPTAITRAEADQRESREKQEDAKVEEERRKAEKERLKEEGPKVGEMAPLGKAAGKGRAAALGQVQKSAQEKREEEARGMTPEMRVRLERERRARAAEERMKRFAGGG